MSTVNVLEPSPNKKSPFHIPLKQIFGLSHIIYIAICASILPISYYRIVHVASVMLLEARIGSSGRLVYAYFVARPASLRISSLLASASFCRVFPAARAAFFLRSSSSLTTTQTNQLLASCLANTRHVLQLDYLSVTNLVYQTWNIPLVSLRIRRILAVALRASRCSSSKDPGCISLAVAPRSALPSM